MCFHQENKLLPSTLYFSLINQGFYFLLSERTKAHWYPLMKINSTANLSEGRRCFCRTTVAKPLLWVLCGDTNRETRASTTLKDWLFPCVPLYLLSTKRVILAAAARRIRGGGGHEFGEVRENGTGSCAGFGQATGSERHCEGNAESRTGEEAT